MEINGDTKVGALLDAHPELEAVLITLSPEFKRLENPLLRRTVARIATLSQAARIGGIPAPDLVRTLRRALGQEVVEPPPGHEAPDTLEPEPEWARGAAPSEWLDAERILAGSGSPVGVLGARLAEAAPGTILGLRVPFYPAPLVDALRQRGFALHTREAGAVWEVLARA
ncbi:MAG: DUF1858 domain-containing protein [Thermoanaerobaculaceae bacterium]|nr:DUF1858 domain-containing protein [Thermoanaerobaculaceae bacterium]MDI9623104.1 DUF1858 domain-containing protein [Acidobacteriota bacterium]NLH11395.1 DUF1858 domain-containing protein [Holophagae bacterium]HPW55419.1 DUF1858 domain-containing protein [Thermoanaerobaculaceae bacterium]